jgi:hypothetical protein
MNGLETFWAIFSLAYQVTLIVGNQESTTFLMRIATQMHCLRVFNERKIKDFLLLKNGTRKQNETMQTFVELIFRSTQ